MCSSHSLYGIESGGGCRSPPVLDGSDASHIVTAERPFSSSLSSHSSATVLKPLEAATAAKRFDRDGELVTPTGTVLKFQEHPERLNLLI